MFDLKKKRKCSIKREIEVKGDDYPMVELVIVGG